MHKTLRKSHALDTCEDTQCELGVLHVCATSELLVPMKLLVQTFTVVPVKLLDSRLPCSSRPIFWKIPLTIRWTTCPLNHLLLNRVVTTANDLILVVQFIHLIYGRCIFIL